MTTINIRTIAEICVRLDGLTLAIELAGARINLLPPQALLARLQHRLDVLTSGPQDVPARQQTLRNMLAWSYDLLDAGEQRLFRRLSIFVGGCTLEAVEAIYQALGEMPADLLDRVASLIDKSLLRQTEQEGEELCFVMLEKPMSSISRKTPRSPCRGQRLRISWPWRQSSKRVIARTGWPCFNDVFTWVVPSRFAMIV